MQSKQADELRREKRECHPIPSLHSGDPPRRLGSVMFGRTMYVLHFAPVLLFSSKLSFSLDNAIIIYLSVGRLGSIEIQDDTLAPK